MTTSDALLVAGLTVLWLVPAAVLAWSLVLGVRAVRLERRRHAEFQRRAQVFEEFCVQIRDTPPEFVNWHAVRGRMHVLAAWVEEMAGGDR